MHPWFNRLYSDTTAAFNTELCASNSIRQPRAVSAYKNAAKFIVGIRQRIYSEWKCREKQLSCWPFWWHSLSINSKQYLIFEYYISNLCHSFSNSKYVQEKYKKKLGLRFGKEVARVYLGNGLHKERERETVRKRLWNLSTLPCSGNKAKHIFYSRWRNSSDLMQSAGGIAFIACCNQASSEKGRRGDQGPNLQSNETNVTSIRKLDAERSSTAPPEESICIDFWLVPETRP